MSSILTVGPFIWLAVCPNMATLNETSGILTSPYYPRLYRSYEKCSWKITANEGERIVLVIEDLYIRDCGSSCTCDYLKYKMAHLLMAFQAGEDVDIIKTVG